MQSTKQPTGQPQKSASPNTRDPGTPRKWLNYEVKLEEPAEGPGTPIVMKIGRLSARPGTALAGRPPGLRNPSIESGLKRVPNQLTASGRWPGGHEAEGQQGPRSPPR